MRCGNLGRGFLRDASNNPSAASFCLRNNLTVGQEVVTAGGIYGKIKDLDVTTVTLEIASGVKIKIDRNSIYANAQQGTNN